MYIHFFFLDATRAYYAYLLEKLTFLESKYYHKQRKMLIRIRIRIK